MMLPILISILCLSSCHQPAVQVKPATAKTKKVVKQHTINFTGAYAGAHLGNEIFISLQSSGTAISGTFTMNGEKAMITGTIKNGLSSGKIVEEVSGKIYSFTAQKKGDDLNFNLIVPEQNNQQVTIFLKKQSATALGKVASNKAKSPAMVGTWRFTEVISSGSGQFYSSFSTDYFLRLNADGTGISWTGKSAGGTKDVTIDGSGGNRGDRLEWYTEGKILYLVDPATRQKSAVNFYAEPNRMMLTGNKGKRVYQRVSGN